MKSVRQMVAEQATIQAILRTMPTRPMADQEEVWAIGIAKLVARFSAAKNRQAGTVISRVVDGQERGFFFDPLDEAEAYVRGELRLSRSREEGEKRRQDWLMAVLVKVGEARVAGALTLMEYPPAAALVESEPVGTDG